MYQYEEYLVPTVRYEPVWKIEGNSFCVHVLLLLILIPKFKKKSSEYYSRTTVHHLSPCNNATTRALIKKEAQTKNQFKLKYDFELQKFQQIFLIRERLTSTGFSEQEVSGVLLNVNPICTFDK